MASVLMEVDMYGGRYHVIHNPHAKGSQPRYRVLDRVTGLETRPTGVTTILSRALAKDLGSWKLNCMEEVLAKKCPNITVEDLAHAKLESERRRNSGADTGTEAHALVELLLKQDEALSEALEQASEPAEKAYIGFLNWFNKTKPDVLGVEEVVYSPTLNYAGTYDCLLRINGKNYLCDFKTTNSSRNAPMGVYPEMFLQLGAYAGAHEERRLAELSSGGIEMPKIEGLMVISGKKTGKLDIVTNEDVGLEVWECMSQFNHVVGIDNFLATASHRLKSLKGAT